MVEVGGHIYAEAGYGGVEYLSLQELQECYMLRPLKIVA